MLKPRSLDNHKRKQSQIQLFHPSDYLRFKSVEGKKLEQMKSKQAAFIKNSHKINKNTKNIKIKPVQKQKQKNRILKLVSSSSDKIKQKNIVIQHINNQNINFMNMGHLTQEELYSQIETDINSQTDSFFQFGRKRQTMDFQNYYKQNTMMNINQLNSSNQFNNNINTYLNMEEIIQVPDTMSNERRYDTSNLDSSLKGFLNNQVYNNNNCSNSMSFSKPLQEKNNTLNNDNDFTRNNNNFQDFKEEDTNQQTLQPLKSLSKVMSIKSKSKKSKKEPEVKPLKQRKNKQPRKPNFKDKEPSQKQAKFDFSQMIVVDSLKKQRKQFVINNNFSKSKFIRVVDKSKSSDMLKKLHNSQTKSSRSKSKASLITNLKSYNKSKNYSHATLANNNKKKSLSLKCKHDQEKLTQQNQTSKAKSSQKPTFNNGKQECFQPELRNNLKNNLNNKIMLIQQSQSKLYSQYKILWQCIGQLWENSRITRYISEKNKSQILKIKDNQFKIGEKIMQLKSQIVKEISSARY